MAIQLRERGITSFVVLERAGDVGGTWRDNVYPGCACDIPSALYSFSFEPNHAWTRAFPEQAELWQYLRSCVDKYGIRSHLRFGKDVVEARYEEASATWLLRCTDGLAVRSRVIVSATGPLNRPSLPSIPGAQRFTGDAFHSSRWDTSIDLRGKRVAVIGTGASAIQIVPAIAPLAEKLTLFQRTPPWVIPRRDAAVSPRRRALYRRLPGYARLVRGAIYWFLEIRALAFTRKPSLMQAAEKLALRHLAAQISDPALRARLTPAYRMGCKRVLVSDDYYPSLLRPNVEVVSEPIEALGERSIASGGIDRPVDVVVFATGFRATEGVSPLRVYGRNGVELGQTWRDGMQAYLGTAVAGFPNLFTIIGPNTGLGHNSMIVMMEAQYRYIVDALRVMRRRNIVSLEVRAAVQAEFNRRLQRRMQATVWSAGCASWYQDSHGKNTTLWPGFTFTYRFLTRRFDLSRYVAGVPSKNRHAGS
jgi:cation diffusion facilitator CzcD-associated flavoprotein CzcO